MKRLLFEPTPHSQMWHWTNQATHFNASAKKQTDILKRMAKYVTSDTVEPFTACLRDVLRYSPHVSGRILALQLLPMFVSDADLEWTIWLHRKRDISYHEHAMLTDLEDAIERDKLRWRRIEYHANRMRMHLKGLVA